MHSTKVISLVVTCVEYQSLAGDTRAVIIHGLHLNRVAGATCEGVKATGEVGGLAADIVMITVGCHCVLYSAQTGRP